MDAVPFEEWAHRDGDVLLGMLVGTSYELLLPGYEKPEYYEDRQLEGILVNILKKQRDSRSTVGFGQSCLALRAGRYGPIYALKRPLPSISLFGC